MITLDTQELEKHVKEMYRSVALNPKGEFHFEMGRDLAEKLGYSSADLDQIPTEAIDSFAGVGHHLDLAAIRPGERVIDLGSGSGTDSFVAALKVGDTGSVVGIDMTDEQIEKAERLRSRDGFTRVSYRKGRIEALPVETESFDVVISNGVINLSAEKERVFKEAARALRAGGRLAISDIVSEQALPEEITCDSTVWASCIGGAMQLDRYLAAITVAGFRIVTVHQNPQYEFLSGSAQRAGKKYGVKSISLLAEKD